MLLNDQEVKFKLDTGADVMVISDDLWTSLGRNQTKLPKMRLHGPDKTPMEVLGEFQTTLSYKGRLCTQFIFLVR